MPITVAEHNAKTNNSAFQRLLRMVRPALMRSMKSWFPGSEFLGLKRRRSMFTPCSPPPKRGRRVSVTCVGTRGR